jgi:hypothetical protein
VHPFFFGASGETAISVIFSLEGCAFLFPSNTKFGYIPVVNTVLIQAPAEDAKFFDRLKDQGAEVQFFEVDRFEGLSEIVQVVVTLTAAVTPLLVAYFKEQTANAKNRMVIIDGKKIRLNGYSANEVEKLLRGR